MYMNFVLLKDVLFNSIKNILVTILVILFDLALFIKTLVSRTQVGLIIVWAH